MATRGKYIRTEPPVLLTGPLTVHLDRGTLDALNEYRQAQHAWLACAEDSGECTRLREAMERAGGYLALYVAIQAAHQLGEPSNWADD